MSRNIDPTLEAALSNKLIYPVFFVMLTFASTTKYIWSGVGNVTFNGQTYAGIGSLGSISAISESDDLNAQGVSLQLSGIDTALLQDCLTDIQIGAPAQIWFGLMNNVGALIGTPYSLFAGLVDVPTISIGAKTLTIALALENRLIDLSRPGMRRYTSADQRLYFPDDTAFTFVEMLNDLALVWGQ